MVITMNALYFQAIQEQPYTETVLRWLLFLAEQSCYVIIHRMARLALRLLMYAISDC